MKKRCSLILHVEISGIFEVTTRSQDAIHKSWQRRRQRMGIRTIPLKAIGKRWF